MAVSQGRISFMLMPADDWGLQTEVGKPHQEEHPITTKSSFAQRWRPRNMVGASNNSYMPSLGRGLGSADPGSWQTLT